MNKSNSNTPTDTDANCEMIASQEEMYLEETEEELRAIFISTIHLDTILRAECRAGSAKN